MSAIAKIKTALQATQVDLARITGRNQATISRWERGLDHPRLDDLQKLRDEFARRDIPWSEDLIFEGAKPSAAA